MLKVVPLLLSMVSMAVSPLNVGDSFITPHQFNATLQSDGTYLIESVKSEFLLADELRIYGQDFDAKRHYAHVASNAFDGASFSKLMVSKDVITFSPTLENKTIYFTGSEIEFAPLEPQFINCHINYYACDEGFINFWMTNIRSMSSICDVLLPANVDIYNELYTLYAQLDLTGDKEKVDNFNDGESTIKKSMEYLDSLANPTPSPSKPHKMSKDMMLYFVLIVASIGMTSICIFYLLKDKNIID